MADESTLSPRDIPPGNDLETPLYTLVWRGMQQLYAQIEQTQLRERQALDSANSAWIVLADEYDHLRRVQASQSADAADDGLAGTLRRLEQVLQQQAIDIIAPTGQPYTDEWAEIIHNENAIHLPDLTTPSIHDVIVPAIKRQGKTIRTGKAIIALPDDG